MPKVSVIMAAYNPSERFIREALESVFAQSLGDFEVLIIDDGSGINVPRLLGPFNDRVKYFYQKNAGQSSARLLGMREAKGEYIALIDHDDLWVKDKLEKQVKFLDAYSELDYIFSDFHNFDEKGFHPKSYFGTNRYLPKIPYDIAINVGENCRILKGNFVYEYLRGNFIIQCTTMARKTSAEKYKMFHSVCNGREHHEFATKTIHLTKIGYVNEVLAHRRLHGNNMSFNPEVFSKSTITLYGDALSYPWMDSRCRCFMKSEILRQARRLGIYYLAKGRNQNARNEFIRFLKMRFYRIDVWGLLFASHIMMPRLVNFIKKIKREAQ